MDTKRFSHSRRALLGFFLFCGLAGQAGAQQVTITSPSSGTMYTPGSTINVTANVTGGTVLGVRIGVQDIGTSAYQLAPPYFLSLTVPSGIVGPRTLFAMGLVANNTAVFSSPVTIDIELSTPPTAITFQQQLVAFGYVGDQERIGVTATFADGSTMDISKSTELSFTSGNNSLVSVDSSGLMTALGVGNTSVTATFGPLTATLQTVGPTGVRGDLNGDGFVTQDDLLRLQTMLGETPTGPNDARDLNGDGKIDSLDVQALLTTCGSNCPSLAATTTSLVPSASQVQFTQPVTFTATVAGNSPAGPVSFLVDGSLRDTGLLGTNGQAAIVSNSLSIGTHSITALYAGDGTHGPSSSQPASVTVTSVPGDANGDGAVNCIDLNLVKAAFGKKTGQPGFIPGADLNHDGIVNVLDLAIVSRAVPVGTVCP